MPMEGHMAAFPADDSPESSAKKSEFVQFHHQSINDRKYFEHKVIPGLMYAEKVICFYIVPSITFFVSDSVIYLLKHEVWY